jgi:cystathionine gamma-synthase
MIIRGMKTMHLRVHTQNNTALKMAQLLEKHPKVCAYYNYVLITSENKIIEQSTSKLNCTKLWQVRHVYYPGLTSHPEHEIAKSQMSGYGGVVSFEVKILFGLTNQNIFGFSYMI